MTTRIFGHFFLGLLAFGALQFLPLLVFMALFFEMWGCGNELIDDRQSETIMFLGFLLMALFIGVAGTRLWRSKKYKFVGAGGLVSNLFTVWMLILTGSFCLNFNVYYQEFSAETWSDSRPFKMTAYVVNYGVLEGKDRSGVIELLGPDEETYSGSPGALTYRSGVPGSPLVVTFVNDRVDEVYLHCLYD